MTRPDARLELALPPTYECTCDEDPCICDPDREEEDDDRSDELYDAMRDRDFDDRDWRD